MKTNKGEKYYSRPYVLWALLSSAICIVSLGGAVYDSMQGSSLSAVLVSRGLVAVTCILLSFWLSALVSWALPICLSKEGIRSYTVFGVYHSIEWTQIAKVETASLFGIRYAKVFSVAGGAPIWIPGFLAKRDRFLAELRQRTAHSGAFEAVFFGERHHSAVGSGRPVGVSS